jgi:hypothetical protein
MFQLVSIFLSGCDSSWANDADGAVLQSVLLLALIQQAEPPCRVAWKHRQQQGRQQAPYIFDITEREMVAWIARPRRRAN